MTKQPPQQHHTSSTPHWLGSDIRARHTTTMRLAFSCLLLCSLSSGFAQDKPTVFGPDTADPDTADLDAAGQRELVLHFPWKFELPTIARYQNLPERMLFEPFFAEPKISRRLTEQFMETWIRSFKESNDLEIRVVALEHLSRISRLKNTDLSPVADALIETLEQTSDRQLFWGCLCVIRDGNLQQAADVLFKIAKTSDDDTLRIVDPLLASWGHEPAIAVWESRLKDSQTTMTNRTLACQALATIKATASSTAIRSAVADPSGRFQLRHAAAVALCQLDPQAARKLAVSETRQSLTEKLLAVALLNQVHQDAMQAMMPYCDDEDSAVALAAWEAVQKHAPQRLLPKLADGLNHNESGIRQCCTRLVAEFPTKERINTVRPLLGDQHIAVRNACRHSFIAIAIANANANRDSQLENVVIDLLAEQMNDPEATWESIEQTCYALAALKRPEFAEACLKRCLHERPEVYIAAAWLYHLMPEPKLNKELKDVVDERVKRATSGNVGPEFSDLDRQAGFLLQAVGYSQQKELLKTMVKQLDKASGLGEHGRSAGVWAIGALQVDSKDEAISARIIDTMNDRLSPLDPEYDVVRRMAAQSLGRIAAQSSIPALQASFAEDSAFTRIPQTIRWALQMMGAPSPGDIPEAQEPISGWRLQPITSFR